MTSLIKIIFLKENERDIFLSLEDQGIDTKVFENKIANLFNRVYNNYVGYYTFKQDEKIYKLIVLPKTINANSDSAEKDFVNYLLHYHRINNKYRFDETKNIEDSLLSLAFKNNNDDKNSHLPLEEFEFYKYKSILESIESFFNKHKNYKRVKVDYSSQSVKYRLDLQKNIKELDKTKLHQTKTVDMMYSFIATISHTALKLFIMNKLKDFNDENKTVLLASCKNINSFIAKKYNLDKGYKLTLSKLNSFKIEKAFKSTNETKKLLVSIKSLFGFEQMYDDVYMSVDNRYDLTTTSFFIDPILFYEWYVYDILKSYTDKNKKNILFDKIDSKTTTKYKLQSIKETKEKSSKPDYILVDEEEKIKIVIDAKWKNIENLVKISSSDYLKLKLDSSLLKDEVYSTSSYLIYPNINIKDNRLKVVTDNNVYFNFNILQVDMNFDKDKNSIDFVYDYKEIKEKIIEETKTEKLKATSNSISTKIEEERTKTITKLINQDNLDNKEEILSELDVVLIESANTLSEHLEDFIPIEIKEILKKYDDVLEDDSKKFLKSSSSIYYYYKDKQYEHFDYSMPGSGLWKLIELELNTSFIWYIRIINNICNSSCKWTPLNTRKTAIFHEIDRRKRVKLNQFEHNEEKLQGVMLGGISLLLNDSEIISEFNSIINVEDLNPSLLCELVKNISDIRNRHAHIKAMSLEKFQELYNLLFDNDEITLSLDELLNFKRTIVKYIKLS